MPTEVINQSQAGEQAGTLLPSSESENFRKRWHEVQEGFVDEPKEAVKKADELVSSAIQRLTDVFAEERTKLETTFTHEQELSTEDLRQALRRYRTFFDRLT